jgi:hypothetical protein
LSGGRRPAHKRASSDVAGQEVNCTGEEAIKYFFIFQESGGLGFRTQVAPITFRLKKPPL